MLRRRYRRRGLARGRRIAIRKPIVTLTRIPRSVYTDVVTRGKMDAVLPWWSPGRTYKGNYAAYRGRPILQQSWFTFGGNLNYIAAGVWQGNAALVFYPHAALSASTMLASHLNAGTVPQTSWGTAVNPLPYFYRGYYNEYNQTYMAESRFWWIGTYLEVTLKIPMDQYGHVNVRVEAGTHNAQAQPSGLLDNYNWDSCGNQNPMYFKTKYQRRFTMMRKQADDAGYRTRTLRYFFTVNREVRAYDGQRLPANPQAFDFRSMDNVPYLTMTTWDKTQIYQGNLNAVVGTDAFVETPPNVQVSTMVVNYVRTIYTTTSGA